MTVTPVLRRVTTVLAGLGVLATLTALALLIAGPVTYATTESAGGGPARAGFGEVWTTWPTVAVCAAVTVALGALALRLRG